MPVLSLPTHRLKLFRKENRLTFIAKNDSSVHSGKNDKERVALLEREKRKISVSRKRGGTVLCLGGGNNSGYCSLSTRSTITYNYKRRIGVSQMKLYRLGRSVFLPWKRRRRGIVTTGGGFTTPEVVVVTNCFMKVLLAADRKSVV